MSENGKFTQGGQKQTSSLRDAHVTKGGLETPVQAFMGNIVDGGLTVPAKGYQDNDKPGARHINIRRKLGADSGPGVLQRFKAQFSGRGRAKD